MRRTKHEISFEEDIIGFLNWFTGDQFDEGEKDYKKEALDRFYSIVRVINEKPKP